MPDEIICRCFPHIEGNVKIRADVVPGKLPLLLDCPTLYFLFRMIAPDASYRYQGSKTQL